MATTKAVTLKDLSTPTPNPNGTGTETPKLGFPKAMGDAEAKRREVLAKLGISPPEGDPRAGLPNDVEKLLVNMEGTRTEIVERIKGLPAWLQDAVAAAIDKAEAILPVPRSDKATAPAAATEATTPTYVNLTKPDPADGNYWKVNAEGKQEFDAPKFDAEFKAWQTNMAARGYNPANYATAPAGTVGQVGSGTDDKGNVYSAMTGPDGNTQMMSAQQIQQSVNNFGAPQTSRDRAAADSLVAIIKGWGLQDDMQVGDNGSITFPNPKALTAYTGLVSKRMMDVMRNNGTQLDALNAGGYQVVSRNSDAWKAYEQQGRK